MLEDDLRTILAEAMTGTAVYSRMIPSEIPEGITVQEIGGRSSTAGIRRNYRTVALMAYSSDRDKAGTILRDARNILIESIPATINGTHYYTAKALADGTLKMKQRAGPRYVAYVDMEVGCSL